MNRFLISVVLWLFSLVLVVGCGKPAPKLYPVRGSITLDGQPLTQGTIYFKTMKTGEVDSLTVKEGQFAGKALAGERRVEVVAYRLIPIAGEMGGEVQESLIASRFNSESKLTITVSPTDSNDYKIAVESK